MLQNKPRVFLFETYWVELPSWVLASIYVFVK